MKPSKRNRKDMVLAAFRKDPHANIWQLAEHCGMAQSSIHYYLTQLEQDGTIKRTRNHGGNKSGSTVKRRADSQATCEKKSAAGRKGKGVDALSFKRDPELQKRIDQVVAKATGNHSKDVVNDYHKYHFRSSGLRCWKVG